MFPGHVGLAPGARRLAPRPGPAAATWLFLILGLLCSASVNWPTLSYEFAYDDYGFVRPHTAGEVLGSFAGPWDSRGPNVAFFRPIAVVFHAARFELLQFDPRLYHLTSVILFGIGAGLAASFVARATASRVAGGLALCFIVVHPHMPLAATAWVTNQMHLLQLIVFAAGLRWWAWCRDRGAVSWLPLVVLQAVSFLIKEDGIMFAPLIVGVHVMWMAVVERRIALPPASYLGLALVTGGAELWWRHLALGGVGGYGVPEWDRAQANLWSGFYRTIALQPVDQSGKLFATGFAVASSIAGGLLAFTHRDRRRAAFLILAGLAIIVLCNLPYALVTKREQWHLLSLGGAVLLTGAAWAMWQALRPRLVRVALAAVTVTAMLSMAWVSRQMAGDLAPYAPGILETDRIAAEWSIVAPEIREYLIAKQEAWRHGRRMAFLDSIPIITYGIHDWEADGDGRRFRWTSDHVTLFARAGGGTLRLPLGAVKLPGDPSTPKTVTYEVDGSNARKVPLEEGRWTTIEIACGEAPSWSPSRLTRIDLRFAPAVVPAQVVPGSGDTRTIAARMGEAVLSERR